MILKVVLYYIRISEVKMQESKHNQSAINARRKMGVSTTLNRKYVRQPRKSTDNITVAVKKSPKVRHFGAQTIVPSKKVEEGARSVIQKAPVHPMQKTANERLRQYREQVASQQKKKLTAKELKDQAISKALVEAAQAGEAEEKVEKTKIRFGFPRVVLALFCAAVVVFMIVYFVNLNMPDISLRVAAMQTGFEASYPSYVPRDYTLSGITSEEGNITLNFKNHSTETTFSLVEKKSTWDSNALLNNFVKSTYGENYSVIREQGLTIYISDSNATWVNGGVVYNLNAETSNLTKKQIKSIAVSL